MFVLVLVLTANINALFMHVDQIGNSLFCLLLVASAGGDPSSAAAGMPRSTISLECCSTFK